MRAYIYKITNIKTNKVYIGQTIQKYQIRFAQHRYRLKSKKHDNPKLQHSVNKWGIDNFKFDVIAECDLDERFELEKYYIQKYNSISNGYNILFGDKIVEDWVQKDLINKPFLNSENRKFNEDEVYMIKSAQNLFGSLQRPLSRILNCHATIIYNIYHNKRYKECCAKFNAFSFEKQKQYFSLFLEKTNFSTKEIQILNSNMAIICFVLREDLNFSNSEIMDIFNTSKNKLYDLGVNTWKKEKEEHKKLTSQEKQKIIELLIIYCNFHRQSITKLQNYLKNV